MLDKLFDQVTQVPFPEDHKVIETLISYRLYEALRVGVAVGTLCRNGHTLDSAGLQERRPCLRVQRVSVVDQIVRVAQESIHWIKQVPGNLLHPRTCLLYTSDAADEEDSVDLGGRRIIK